MKPYTPDQVRNVALVGHGGSGKTTLAEAMLLASGATTRLGSVDDGNTVSDFDEQEHAHRYSISTSMLAIEWQDRRLNVLDTPGFADFEGEVACALAAADAAVVTVDASSGIQGGTESTWARANDAGPLPRIVAVTRMDREHADFDAVLARLRDTFGVRVVPIALPIGAASGFSGLVDLISGRARAGADGSAAEPPAGMADAIQSARDMLVEAAAEADDALLNRYLEGETISDDELRNALGAAVASGSAVPVVPVSATTGVGVRALLDAVADLLPSPLGREHALENGTLTTKADGPLVVHVFKTTADPFVGRLSYMKVLSGTLKPDANPFNVQRGATERLGHLYLQRGKTQIEVPQLVAGDIGVAAKLSETQTGDTLVASQAQAVKAPPLPLPVSTYRSALHPRTKADVDKLSSGLARLTEQDPTIRVERDHDTGETVMTTLGEAQVNIVAARLARNYGVAVDAAEPRVPYRETVSASAKSEYRHKKQTGGHGQFGHVVINIDPVARGQGVSFREKVVGGNVPRQFIPAVEKGIMETLPDGPLAHSPIVDVQVTLLDGSAHSVDSSEMAFKLAASQALKQGILQARPILLEPIVRLTIRVQSDRVGDVMSDLNTRRAHVHGVEPAGAFSIVEAEAPLATVQRYSVDLRSITQGRGSFTVKRERYAEVPAHVQEQVLRTLVAAEA